MSLKEDLQKLGTEAGQYVACAEEGVCMVGGEMGQADSDTSSAGCQRSPLLFSLAAWLEHYMGVQRRGGWETLSLLPARLAELEFMFSAGGDLVFQVGLPDKLQDAQLNQHFR